MTDRKEVAERLRAVELCGGSHESLSAIARAVLPDVRGGWTLGACERLRDELATLVDVGGTGDGITDELRSSVANYPFRDNRDFSLFEAIADRIDAEHKKAPHEAYPKGWEDGMGVANAKDAQAEYLRGRNDGYDDGWDAGFASADDWLAQHEDAMAEHGWVRLPKDADGEYWFCGDKIMLPDGNVVEVIGIGGDWLYYLVTNVAMTVIGRIRAHDKRHYKQPTVEDTLREFFVYAERGKEHHREDVDDAVLAVYAAKLRLAGGDAE